ncbi:MAG: DUF3822 family protein [Prevotellaceae bacterium]|jgi:hypothetical protein|nr:DUF3822 family protein [Prevotellaceae bacterium]
MHHTPFAAIDSTFDVHSSSAALHLSIQSDLGGLCFCVLDLDKRRYVAFKSIPYEQPITDYNDMQPTLSALLDSDPLLNASYRSVSYIYTSRHATAIPTAMFDSNLLKSFLEINDFINELDEVHSCPIPQLDAVAAFAVPSPFATTLLKKYGEVKFYHQCVPMLTFLQEHAGEHNPKSLLAININHGFVDTALYIRGALKIYNTFALQSPEDLAYFMLAITSQHKVETRQTSVLFSGNVEPYVKVIPPFFQVLMLDEPHTQMSFARALSDVVNHRFSHLFSLYECA